LVLATRTFNWSRVCSGLGRSKATWVIRRQWNSVPFVRQYSCLVWLQRVMWTYQPKADYKEWCEHIDRRLITNTDVNISTEGWLQIVMWTYRQKADYKEWCEHIDKRLITKSDVNIPTKGWLQRVMWTSLLVRNSIEINQSSCELVLD